MIDIKCCDNLELMYTINDNTIDLIYCDILYGTGRKFKDYQDLKPIRSEIEAHYIPRIKEMHRILKDTGSIYLQMDTKINHWLRCILDDIFGYDNFLNEIIWHYKKFSQNNDKTFLTNHDVILYYTKGEDYKFNPQYVNDETKEKRISKGFFNCGGKRILVYDWSKFNKDKYDGYKFIDRTDDTPVKRVDDVFTDIMFLNSQHKERNGYDTQKPKALIERIIKASSNEGDLVADFYLGSGTTAEVCEDLNRNFIGCDINAKAVEIAKSRVYKKSNEFFKF